ncbi:MAG: MFS transporter, partial [Actinomycetota bacterium]
MTEGARAAAPAEAPIRRPEFRRLLAISITVALGFGMLIPVLPGYARSFGVSLATAGLVQLVFGLTRFSFGIVGGLFVDRFGDRASTMTGLLIVSASSFATGLATDFPMLVAARGFGGAGSSLFIAGLMTRILRIIEPEAMGRASGTFRASFLVGIAAGPLLGGLVATALGPAATFHFYGAGLLVATAIAWFAMRGATRGEGAQRKAPVEALRAAAPLFSDVRYVAALAATFVGWWTLSGPAQFIAAVFAEEELGFSEGQIGLAASLLAAGEIAALTVAGRAADRYGRRAVLVPTLVLTALATGLIGQTTGAAWAFYALLAVVGIGTAASGTAAGGLLGDAIPEGTSGAAVGVNQMAGDLGYLVAPSALGLVAGASSFGVAYGVAALPAALAALLSLRLPAHRGPAGRESPADAVEP